MLFVESNTNAKGVEPERKDMSDPVFNEDQNKALDDTFAFLLHTERKEHIIDGPGGTGKTFMIQQIVGNLMQKYKDAAAILGIKQSIFNMAVTATTNTAADVLSGSLNIPTQTIHSYLGLRVFENLTTGKTEITKTSSFMVRSNTLVIIDEASMIDFRLYAFLHEALDNSCKIIFVGDVKQLAPVGETLSKAFRDIIPRSTLKIPMRNSKSPALMALCNTYRKVVDTLVFPSFDPVPGVIDFLTPEQAKAEVTNTFHDEGADARILAYTNQKVRDFNSFIRKVRGYSDILEDGELVVNCNSMVLAGGQHMSAESTWIVNRQYEERGVIDKIPEVEIPGKYVNLISVTGKGSRQVFIPDNMQLVRDITKTLTKLRRYAEKSYLSNNIPDLRGRDSSTVHKAQGMTCHTVYIDFANIGTCKNANMTARQLYVAVSRATDRVAIIGRLPPKYWKS